MPVMIPDNSVLKIKKVAALAANDINMAAKKQKPILFPSFLPNRTKNNNITAATQASPEIKGTKPPYDREFLLKYAYSFTTTAITSPPGLRVAFSGTLYGINISTSVRNCRNNKAIPFLENLLIELLLFQITPNPVTASPASQIRLLSAHWTHLPLKALPAGISIHCSQANAMASIYYIISSIYRISQHYFYICVIFPVNFFE